jgi:hydrogenase nickel incorporation protein HypA/HybF
MHEITIAKKIIGAVKATALKQGFQRINKAKLKIGRMHGFEAKQLNIALKTFQGEEILQGLVFDIDTIPVKLYCRSCRHNFMDERFENESFAHQVAHAPVFYIPPKCPSCFTDTVELVSGNELELLCLEGN